MSAKKKKTETALIAIERRVFSEAAAKKGGARRIDLPDAAAGAVWAASKKTAPEARVVAFCAGRDVHERPMADSELIAYDVWTNAAHTLMLRAQKIVAPAAAAKILRGLAELEKRHAVGEFALKPALEDVHINIEHKVGELVGEIVAGRMHTGRSRNDQVATDMRLWLRDRLLEIEAEAHALAAVLIERAAAWAAFPMPGYTHQQPGMISSLGYWAAAHAQALLRDAGRLAEAYRIADRCPLGSAAGYGTSWPLDRALTAKLLGFAAVEEIGLDGLTNRWEPEATAVQALAFLFTHLSIIAQDLILNSSPPRAFLRLPARFTTGSSIMPQKRNPDFAEVIRAKAAHLHGQLTALLGQAKGMISGYNRDTQWSKYAAMDAFAEARGGADVLALVLADIEPDAARMADACREGFLNAVEVADYLAREHGADFRSTYKIMGAAVEACRAEGALTCEAVEAAMREAGLKGQIPARDWAALNDPAKLLGLRRTLGSPAPAKLKPALKGLGGVLKSLRAAHAKRLAHLEAATAEIRRLRSPGTKA